MQNYQFNIFLYFLILGTGFWLESPPMIISTVIIGLLILISIPIYRNIKINNIKSSIKNNPDLAILNINKAAWWEFSQLPNISIPLAKKIVYTRKQTGNYSSIDDFFNKNSIKNRETVEKLIEL